MVEDLAKERSACLLLGLPPFDALSNLLIVDLLFLIRLLLVVGSNYFKDLYANNIARLLLEK